MNEKNRLTDKDWRPIEDKKGSEINPPEDCFSRCDFGKPMIQHYVIGTNRQ